MGRDVSKSRKARYTFNTIEAEGAYKELKAAAELPSHKQLNLRSIFEVMEQDVTRVKLDVASVFDAVNKDITFESVQMETVEAQLRKSAKKLQHIYDKVSSSRERNQRFTSSSEILQELSTGVEKLSSNLDSIKDTTDDILHNIVKIDARIPSKSRLLNGQVFNEQHYPLLFDLVRVKYGHLLEESAADEGHRDSEEASDAQDPTAGLSATSQDPTHTPTDSGSTATVDDLITQYRLSQTAKASTTQKNDVFLPPSLRKVSKPSTKTTLETISAENIFKGTPS